MSQRLPLILSLLVAAIPAYAQPGPGREGGTSEANGSEASEAAASEADVDASSTTSASDAAEPDAAGSDLEGYVPPGSESADLEGYAAPATTPDAATPSDESDTQVTSGEDPPGLPPPGPPRADEQQPAPVGDALPASPSRRLIMGMYLGPMVRSSEDERITYGTSVAWGPSATVVAASWLRVTGYGRLESIPVDTTLGAFDTELTRYPDTTIEQASLDSIGLGLRAAPTLEVSEWLRLMAFVDLAWNRFTAAAPVTKGATQVRSAERAGVGLNYKAGLGASVEPIANWLDVSLSASYGFFTSQTGSAFKGVLQGFDQTGNIVHLAPLPRFERSFELLLAAGIIL